MTEPSFLHKKYNKEDSSPFPRPIFTMGDVAERICNQISPRLTKKYQTSKSGQNWQKLKRD